MGREKPVSYKMSVGVVKVERERDKFELIIQIWSWFDGHGLFLLC